MRTSSDDDSSIKDTYAVRIADFRVAAWSLPGENSPVALAVCHMVVAAATPQAFWQITFSQTDFKDETK